MSGSSSAEGNFARLAASAPAAATSPAAAASTAGATAAAAAAALAARARAAPIRRLRRRLRARLRRGSGARLRRGSGARLRRGPSARPLRGLGSRPRAASLVGWPPGTRRPPSPVSRLASMTRRPALMRIVRAPVRRRVVVPPTVIRGRPAVVRVPAIPVVVVVRAPDRKEDQRRDVHACPHVHGRRRGLWLDGFRGYRGGLLGACSGIGSARRRRRPIDDFVRPRLRPAGVVEHPLLAVPLPARGHEDHVLDLVHPLAAFPFELLSGPCPVTGEPMVRSLCKRLRGRLLLFEILGSLRMRRSFIGPTYRRRFSGRRILRRIRHVLRNLVRRSNLVSLRGFLRQGRCRESQSQREHQEQSHSLFDLGRDDLIHRFPDVSR